MTYMPVWYLQNRSALLLLQSVIGLMLVSYPMKKRSRFPLRLILSVLAGCAVQYMVRGIYIAGSTPAAMLTHAASALLVYITLNVITWFCYDESVWTVLFMSATGYLAQDIAGSVKTLARQTGLAAQLLRWQPGMLILDLICYGAVYVLMYFILRPFVRNREDNFDNKKKALFSVAVLLLCIVMARLSQDNPDRGTMAVAAEAVFQILIDVMVIALQFGVMEQARLNSNMETMRELVHTQRVQYEASKESAQLINEKYHDLKHLLKSFQGTVPQEQLDKLKQSIAAYERPANSGNEVLDVLLAEKIGICQQRGIVLTCSLGMTDFSFVEELDLYSLFQNALTNAINAVSALPEGAERFISLSSARDGNMLSIHMENPCGEDIPFVDGLPQTRDDPAWHGFGMKSMDRIAQKYSGTLTAEQRGKMFFLDILLLAPEK
ncbi:MAG: GHKL domain-containing protein [Clostridia bacterium]|nr:GHKL domain-containing protein [Clostridia bacterium]